MKKRLSLLIVCFMAMLTFVGCGAPKEVGFELVSAGKQEYYINETLDLSGVSLNAVYKKGKKESRKTLDKANVTIDSSAVDMAQAGEYTVKISYKEYADVTYTVTVLDKENGFELVSAGKTEYLLNETLDFSGIQLRATYLSGKTEALSLQDVTIDTSAVDMTQAGEYTVVVSYKEYDNISYTIVVSEREVGFEITATGKTDYYLGETLDFSGLVLKAVFENGAKVNLPHAKVNFDVSAVNIRQVGEYTVSVLYKEYAPLTFKVRYAKKEVGFEVNTLCKLEYYVGESLNLTGLTFKKVFEVGDAEVLNNAELTINSTAVQMNNVGEYDIVVSYKEYDDIILKVKVMKEEVGFALATPGNTTYYVGETVEPSRIQLKSIFKIGAPEVLSIDKVTVDTSAVNMEESGVYTVTISYKDYEDVTYTINVYEYKNMTLGFYQTEKLPYITTTGNNVYYNNSFRAIYGIGDTLDTKALSVWVEKTCGANKEDLKITNYTISGFDSTTVGTHTLTVTYEYITGRVITATVDVYVIDTEPSVVNGVYQVKVDKNFNGVVGEVVDGFNMFTTVQQALEFLADADEAAAKLIVIGEGLFEEKLEITIPNLTIIGSGSDKTTIEWNSIYNVADASGFVQTTESTATVSVREEAVNCVFKDITISSYWNSQERYDQAGLEIERAAAMLIQSDKFMMKGCAVLGIQDTLALFRGRQYFEDTYISGYMDFIFGTNNTTYFKDCTIHVVKTNKAVGAVVTAFKGCSLGEQDHIEYGVIFDGCKFTADKDVAANSSALGRPWGSYASVVTINSHIGGHISKSGYSTGDFERYVDMNAEPTAATVKYREYNNTGDGAITEAVSGMEMLAEGTVLYYYANLDVVFGKINGNIGYVDIWDIDSVEVGGNDKTYYFFDGSSNLTGISNTFAGTTLIADGSTYKWKDLLMSAEKGKIAFDFNSNCLNMREGAFIRFNVKAGTLVIVETHNRYSFFTINGVATSSASMLQRYFAEDTVVTVLSTGNLYLHSIILDPNAEEPEMPTLNEISVEGLKTEYEVGETISYNDLIMKGYYSDASIVTILSAYYNIDDSLVNKDEEGTYTIIFTFGGRSTTIDVTYTNSNKVYEIVNNTYLDFSTAGGYAAVQENPRVTLDGSFRLNGAEYQVKGIISFPVKAGTTVTVIPFSNASYVSYTLGMYGESELETLNSKTSKTFEEDCVVVYTGLDNNYLVGIQISCLIEEGKYVFGGSTEQGDYTGILGSVANLVVTGTITNHSGGVQFYKNAEVSFNAPALTTIVIQGHDATYGQFDVYLNDELIPMDKGVYTIFTGFTYKRIRILPKNVGTEDAPDYSKSYLRYINVNTIEYIEESVAVNFGDKGNYKDVVGFDISNIQIVDNGGSNSQVKNGSITFAIKAGTKVTINGYAGHTSYTLGDDTGMTTGELTDTVKEYTAQRDIVLTITPVNNNYFCSIIFECP